MKLPIVIQCRSILKGNAVQWGEAKRTGWQNRMNFALKVLVPTPKIIRPHCAPQSNAINFKGNAVQCWIDPGALRWSELVDKKRASFALKNHASLLLFSSNHDRLISILRVEQVSASSGRFTKANFAKKWSKNCLCSYLEISLLQKDPFGLNAYTQHDL